ncbi:MAG: 2-C-methyl-D-erythritol 4-phosphate cytidylyltransferase [Fidelibacterota bacterium]
MRVGAIIAGAGESSRFSGGKSPSSPFDRKQFKPLGDEPLILVTARPFLECDLIDSVVLVVPEDALPWMEEEVRKNRWQKEVRVVSGGLERQESVRNGLEVIAGSCDVVVIHDAVRPFVRSSWIEETVGLCVAYDGAIVAVQASDTLKRVEEGVILETVERRGVWQAQTPQAFRTASLLSAFNRAGSTGGTATDEAQLVERNGGRVAVIPGSPLNLKITSPEDWDLALSLWEGRRDD